MCRNGTCREEATLMSENRGRVFVGTERAVRISPDDGVEGHGEEAFPVLNLPRSALKDGSKIVFPYLYDSTSSSCCYNSCR